MLLLVPENYLKCKDNKEIHTSQLKGSSESQGPLLASKHTQGPGACG